MSYLTLVIIAIFVSPIFGGLLAGVDRKITARMQGRQGPPILQPFYDVIKLLSKERTSVTNTQVIYVIGHLLFMIGTVVMFFTGQDLLMLVFILAFSSIFLIMGAMSVRSPYSKIGAQREIIQMMAYEPVILLMVVGVYLTTNSFMIKEVISIKEPLLYKLPLLFAAFLLILTIKLRKSPFDFSTSHHGHQELIKGLTTEFSGLQLAMVEISHWYESVLLLGLIFLFFANPIWVGILLALASYFLEIVLDNISARTTWQFMLKIAWIAGLGMAITNIVWLYLGKAVNF